MELIPEQYRQHLLECHGKEEAEAWMERLPDVLASCARRWQLTLLPPFPNLSFHYATPAIRADGTHVVVRVAAPTGEFECEAEAMRVFGGQGTARLLACDQELEVMLLERLEPGTTLAELVPEQDERATSILTATMRKLWRPAPAQHNFPTVAEWFQGFARLRERYNGGCGPLPQHLVEEAEVLVKELIASSGPPMLLHGDLHHDNVLLSGNEWRAIDAKGVVGDPGYETGLLFYNPIPKLFHLPDRRNILARRLDQLAEELSMDRQRIRGWGLAQCMLSCWWSMEDESSEEPPLDVLACAEIVSGLE
jgi:streptomycin 6-kinase